MRIYLIPIQIGFLDFLFHGEMGVIYIILMLFELS